MPAFVPVFNNQIQSNFVVVVACLFFNAVEIILVCRNIFSSSEKQALN